MTELLLLHFALSFDFSLGRQVSFCELQGMGRVSSSRLHYELCIGVMVFQIDSPAIKNGVTGKHDMDKVVSSFLWHCIFGSNHLPLLRWSCVVNSQKSMERLPSAQRPILWSCRGFHRIGFRALIVSQCLKRKFAGGNLMDTKGGDAAN